MDKAAKEASNDNLAWQEAEEDDDVDQRLEQANNDDNDYEEELRETE